MKASFRLASASPRRQTIFRLVRIPFILAPSGADERETGADPAALTCQNALAKAVESASRRTPDDPSWTLGADTIVVLGGCVLGKPAGEDQAREMMRRLSGRTHEVVTGWALVRDEDIVIEQSSTVTVVTFKRLDDAMIEGFVRVREWTDKAGGYAIQGLGACMIERIDGDPFNVMGLPVAQVVESFLRHGVIPRFPL